MKKVLLSLLFAVGTSLIVSSCASDEMEEIQIQTIEATNGDEPRPGCDDPNGCDDDIKGSN